MKMISKIAKVAIGLVFIGSAVFGQSLADAKKAIDAEQYQKAKGMLKNLTVTQPTVDENFFYLGWVYLEQDYADSAKTSFTKGIAADPKSAINYVGLGAVALSANDEAGATSNFNQAITLTPKKIAGHTYISVKLICLMRRTENSHLQKQMQLLMH
jgi:predicted negative regulator of RcsB-dependent stress response